VETCVTILGPTSAFRTKMRLRIPYVVEERPFVIVSATIPFSLSKSIKYFNFISTNSFLFSICREHIIEYIIISA
jgi:hypothetical protein